MGGCKCSYRNCTAKSDGKTHLFHFPVFDKVRCHKWLTNSYRLDYLNLKVKQLKNRVVCQHHFTDDNFMNFKKDKLTRSAVPTEDGPFCDSHKIPIKLKNTETVTYPITIEDIENDIYTTNDRRSVSNGMKYGDYLTNGELSDLDYFNPTISDKIVYIKKENFDQLKDVTSVKPLKKSDVVKSYKKTLSSTMNDRKFQNQQISVVQPFSDSNILNITSIPIVLENVPITHEPVQSVQSVQPIESIQPVQTVQPIQPVQYIQSVQPTYTPVQPIQPTKPVQCVQLTETVQPVQPMQSIQPVQLVQPIQSTQPIQPLQIQFPEVGITQLTPVGNMRKKSKIKILSEKNISEPVTVVGKLDSVSPNLILQLPDRRKKIINNNNLNDVQVISHTQEKVDKELVQSVINNNLSDIIQRNTEESQDQILQTVIGINAVPAPKGPHEQIVQKNTTSPSKFLNSVSNKIKKASSPISLLKNKIPPERAADIEKKRKFNMKLKDFLRAGLNNLADQDKINDETLLGIKLKSMNEKSNAQKKRPTVSADLENQQHHRQSTFDFLETRLRKMEDALLDKIEQNSKRIVELKNSMTRSKKSYAVSTQTHVNNESYKKFLYQEISKYMSPDVKSAVYEQLFINKYAQTPYQDPHTAPKRKKRR